jgi:polysaccharide deacetylase family protein (PEP-CTERM system associated)
MTPCMLTFDIEEWFQVENLRPVFPPERWDSLPRRAASSTRRILDLLEEHRVRATFFVLGWVAEREPELVREIVRAGHEIACHGYGHVLPMRLTMTQFRDDVVRARALLESIAGQTVTGYRAPSFSIDGERLAALERLGFSYDSSYNPFGLNDRYGNLPHLGHPIVPGVYRLGEEMIEVSLPVAQIGGFPLHISGGGYFRLYPAPIFRGFVRRALARRGHYEMYLHSWEFDPEQPRVRTLGAIATFRHYFNLSRTLPRVRALVRMVSDLGAPFLTVGDFARQMLALSPRASA